MDISCIKDAAADDNSVITVVQDLRHLSFYHVKTDGIQTVIEDSAVNSGWQWQLCGR